MKEEDSNDTTVLRRELIQHLREADVVGLPFDWCRKGATQLAAQTTPCHDDALERETRIRLPSTDLELPEAAEPLFPGPFESMALDEVEAIAKSCTKCRLCETRNKVVFGVGNTSRPAIAFVGEGPGADEDRVGEPFVGRAGQLLTAAITRGLRLRREDVYICNVVKCRPPENRTPLPDEVERCSPYLYRQLEIVRPRVIVTLGQPAQLALSGVKLGITKLRGTWQTWRGIRLMPTFHPAYLLRNPAAKKEFWLDLQAVMEEAGIPAHQRGPE